MPHPLLAGRTEILAESLAVAAALAAIPGLYAYWSYWPTSRVFGDALVAGDDPKQWALTFDDGPNGSTTLRLLDILARANVRATFFLVGNYVMAQPEIARRVAAAGHLIANHTMSHPRLGTLSPSRQREEIASCSQAIEDLLGVTPKYFRTPHGSRGPATLRIARELGLTPVMWNCVGWDWKLRRGEAIAARLLRDAAKNASQDRGSNLLLHDGSHLGLGADRNATLDAVERILAAGNSSGRHFVTVDAFTAPSR